MRQRSLLKLADGLKNIQIHVDGALIKLLSIHFYQIISGIDSLHATHCNLKSVIFVTFASACITGRKSKAPITSTREFPWKVVTNLFASSIPI